MSGLNMRFIKPCRESDSSPALNPGRVVYNKNRMSETTLFLDLNILIRMEEVILKGKNPQEQGLMPLVNLINQCPPHALCLSPGVAISEVNPKFKKQCYEMFEVFLSIFCPQMIDHPTTIKPKIKDIVDLKRLSFDELELGEQYLHGISYYSLIQIHLIDFKHSDLDPFEKFKLYIEKTCAEIDLISAMEAEIAKYCFCIKKSSYSQEFKDKIQAIRDNFLNRNGNPSKRLINIFNSVRDLAYGKAALKFSEQEFYGKNQETWIATLDDKLYWLTESIHHYPVDNEPHEKYYCIVRNPEQDKCSYWNSVDNYLYKIQEQRSAIGKAVKPLDPSEMEKLHNTIIQKTINKFCATFSSNKSIQLTADASAD